MQKFKQSIMDVITYPWSYPILVIYKKNMASLSKFLNFVEI